MYLCLTCKLEFSAVRIHHQAIEFISLSIVIIKVQVGAGTSLGAGGLRGRSSSRGRVKNFLFPTSSKTALGPMQPPIQWVSGALSPGEKLQRREADHSPPASAEVKKIWIYISTTPYAFMA
jgi:hypothetical protein